MLFRGVVTTMNSGKLGDVVYATNRGTEYVRSLGPPPGEPTTAQQEVRDAVAYAVAEWQGQTEDFRQGWETWARTRLRVDRVCRLSRNTGFNEFVRWSVPRGQANAIFGTGLLQSVVAPIPNTDEPQDFEISLEWDSDTSAVVNWNDELTWPGEDQAVLMIYVSAPISPTRNRAYGGYNLAATIGQNGSRPPGPPTTIPLPNSWTTGQRLFWRARLSSQFRGMSTPQYGRLVYP